MTSTTVKARLPIQNAYMQSNLPTVSELGFRFLRYLNICMYAIQYIHFPRTLIDPPSFPKADTCTPFSKSHNTYTISQYIHFPCALIVPPPSHTCTPFSKSHNTHYKPIHTLPLRSHSSSSLRYMNTII
jgi:hypothetical protein